MLDKLLAGLADKDYAWSRLDIIWIVILGFICGIFMMIGSLWSYFVAGKFHVLLYQKLREKYKK
jgi:NADH:ubiquinone oxidoreductase subunit B-like Fe-S oxidoreductase